jgi:GNAT superfamily N-acetyltransferase
VQGFVVEARPYDDADVVRLVAEVQAEYVRLYGDEDAAAVDPAEFEPPSGLFLVGVLDGAPRARRAGLARRMLAELESTAAAAGVERLILNTGPEQPEAVALYEQAGYRPIPGFGHYACHPDALFYGKALRAPQLR